MEKNMLRDPKMDIIRCFALFCVVCVHFFKHTGFYDVTVVGFGMMALVSLRNFFMICVPLFILLSGYLMRTKAVSFHYYLRIIPILSIYLLASLACSLYTLMFDTRKISFTEMIAGIFGYYTAPYGWYIEMYIGLFLLIPFLNILYNNIPSKTLKQIFVGSLIFLTAGDSLFNDIFPMFPAYWTAMYPITFYFVGCYLSEYPLKLKWYISLLLIMTVFVLSGAVSCCYSYGSVFHYNKWQGHNSIITTIQTILVFNVMMQLDCSHVGPKTAKIFSYASKWSLGAYLTSWIFDSAFYKFLNTYQFGVLDKAKFFIPITLSVYVCSLLLSAILNGVHNLTIGKIVSRLSLMKKVKSL